MKPQPMEVLVENEDLKISLLRGGSDVLFAAFTGIGLGVDGIQPEEFVGSIAGVERSAFYVTDRKRSWYNGPGVMDGALRVLRQLRESLRPRRIVSIGNSMGGFGAILLSRLAPIDTVIGFVPQFSVDPRIVPEETRWKDYTSLIGSYLYPDLSDAFVKRTTYYVFNGLSPVEEIHFRRFPAAENVCSLLFPAESHGVARMLKQDGMLKTVIDLCVDGTMEDVSALMRARYGAVRLPEK